MKIPFLHRITGKVIFEAEIPDDTEERFRVRVGMEVAVKARANLSGAYLSGANLSGAYLRGAYLSDVAAIIPLGYPNGWFAFAWWRDGALRVRVGCRDFTLADGRAYWAGKPHRREVLAALDYAEAVAAIRQPAERAA